MGKKYGDRERIVIQHNWKNKIYIEEKKQASRNYFLYLVCHIFLYLQYQATIVIAPITTPNNEYT